MLTSKTIVIAGGNGLLGKEFVRACKKENARIVVFDASPIDPVLEGESLCDEFYQVNVSDKRALHVAIDSTVSKFHKIDAFVNSAYPKNKNYGREFFNVEYGDFTENISMHLGCYFLSTQVFAEFFKKQGHGNIILLSSIYGLLAPRFEIYKGTSMTMPVEYAVIKAGVISLVKYVASYLKGTSIRINCISPGGILDNQPQSFLDAYNNYCTSKGMLEKEDLTGTLLFLLSDMSRYINSQNLIVDDGFSL